MNRDQIRASLPDDLFGRYHSSSNLAHLDSSFVDRHGYDSVDSSQEPLHQAQLSLICRSAL